MNFESFSKIGTTFVDLNTGEKTPDMKVKLNKSANCLSKEIIFCKVYYLSQNPC